MLQKVLFPGKYIQGAGALGELPALVALFGRCGLILASPTARARVLPESGLDLAASAHSIHNGLTALDETHAFYHGERWPSVFWPACS